MPWKLFMKSWCLVCPIWLGPHVQFLACITSVNCWLASMFQPLLTVTLAWKTLYKDSWLNQTLISMFLLQECSQEPLDGCLNAACSLFVLLGATWERVRVSKLFEGHFKINIRLFCEVCLNEATQWLNEKLYRDFKMNTSVCDARPLR